MPSCPKCASIHLLPVTARQLVPPGVLPPTRKHTFAWAFLAFVFALGVVLLENGSRGVEAVLMMLAIGGSAAAQRAHMYNVRDLPQRENEYRRAMVCSRCGEVVSP